MGKKKCKTKKEAIQKPTHKFECTKCSLTAKKKERLCQPQKIND